MLRRLILIYILTDTLKYSGAVCLKFARVLGQKCEMVQWVDIINDPRRMIREIVLVA